MCKHALIHTHADIYARTLDHTRARAHTHIHTHTHLMLFLYDVQVHIKMDNEKYFLMTNIHC